MTSMRSFEQLFTSPILPCAGARAALSPGSSLRRTRVRHKSVRAPPITDSEQRAGLTHVLLVCEPEFEQTGRIRPFILTADARRRDKQDEYLRRPAQAAVRRRRSISKRVANLHEDTRRSQQRARQQQLRQQYIDIAAQAGFLSQFLPGRERVRQAVMLVEAKNRRLQKAANRTRSAQPPKRKQGYVKLRPVEQNGYVVFFNSPYAPGGMPRAYPTRKSRIPTYLKDTPARPQSDAFFVDACGATAPLEVVQPLKMPQFVREKLTPAAAFSPSRASVRFCQGLTRAYGANFDKRLLARLRLVAVSDAVEVYQSKRLLSAIVQWERQLREQILINGTQLCRDERVAIATLLKLASDRYRNAITTRRLRRRGLASALVCLRGTLPPYHPTSFSLNAETQIRLARYTVQSAVKQALVRRPEAVRRLMSIIPPSIVEKSLSRPSEAEYIHRKTQKTIELPESDDIVSPLRLPVHRRIVIAA